MRKSLTRSISKNLLAFRKVGRSKNLSAPQVCSWISNDFAKENLRGFSTFFRLSCGLYCFHTRENYDLSQLLHCLAADRSCKFGELLLSYFRVVFQRERLPNKLFAYLVLPTSLSLRWWLNPQVTWIHFLELLESLI